MSAAWNDKSYLRLRSFHLMAPDKDIAEAMGLLKIQREEGANSDPLVIAMKA